MPDTTPRVDSIATSGIEATTPWPEARDELAQVRRYWLTTVAPDGLPHVMPLFGVWVDDALYFTSNPDRRKARNLAGNGRCAVAAGAETLDLVLQGEAVRVRDEATLRLIAEAYDAKYGWPLTVRDDGAFDAPYGAPSAGPPPYEPYRITPSVGFGLGMDEPFGATRWRLERGE